MKKITRYLSFLICLLMLCTSINGTDGSLITSLSATKTAQAASISSGTTSNQFIGWKGKGLRRKYYKNGKLQTGFRKIGNDYYLFDSKGRIKTGWQYAGKHYRLFHKKTGKMVRSRTYQGRKIDRNGIWTPIVVLDAGHSANVARGYEPLGPGSSEQKAKDNSGTDGVATGVPEYVLTLNMAKKLQNTADNRNENSTPQGIKWPDKEIVRYILRALVLFVVFVWAMANLDAVLRFLGKVLALFTPFLIGGAIAFLINVVLRPLECCWNKVCRRAPEKLTRPVCLSASTVLVLGILFAVVFMMIPSLRESGDEFIQNIPAYVEEIGRWWTGVVRFAAKYNIVLPEYAIDSDLLIEKVTALISDEGSGILTVTWGAATSVLSALVDALLGLVFALYLLAKKEVVAAHLKKLIVTVLPQKKAQRLLSIASLTNRTFTNFVSGQLTEAVIIGVLCFFGMLILGIPYAGAVSAFVAVTALVPIFGAWIGGGLGAFLIMLAEPGKALWFVLFLLVLQQVEGNLIYPKVVGKSVGLPGLLVLMAVTIGGEAFGILGMLFSVPVCAVLFSLYLEFMKKASTNH